MDDVKVLYIGGYGRSGSTLLDRILGQLPGVCSIGEMRHVWQRGFRENRLCGCGRAFDQCEFWSEVVRRAFGSARRVNVEEVVRLKRSVDRMKYIPRLAGRGDGDRGRFRARLRRYGSEVLAPLYRAIQEVSGAEAIVDSSKDPSYAFVLTNIPEVRVSVTHLVRDSRAVAFSWMRKKRRRDDPTKRSYMPTFGPLVSALRWNAYNYPFHWLKRRVPYRLLRYEEMIREPEDAVRTVMSLVDIHVDAEQFEFLSTDSVQLGPNHTVAGNPLRFHNGALTLRHDDEWSRRMPRGKRALVCLCSLHLMWRYGYLGRGSVGR